MDRDGHQLHSLLSSRHHHNGSPSLSILAVQVLACAWSKGTVLSYSSDLSSSLSCNKDSNDWPCYPQPLQIDICKCMCWYGMLERRCLCISMRSSVKGNAPATVKLCQDCSVMQTAVSMCPEADRVPGDELMRECQQALCIYLLGTLRFLAPLQRAQDVLAAHVEALLRWQRCLLKQVCCLGQEIGCQGLHHWSGMLKCQSP